MLHIKFHIVVLLLLFVTGIDGRAKIEKRTLERRTFWKFCWDKIWGHTGGEGSKKKGHCDGDDYNCGKGGHKGKVHGGGGVVVQGSGGYGGLGSGGYGGHVSGGSGSVGIPISGGGGAVYGGGSPGISVSGGGSGSGGSGTGKDLYRNQSYLLETDF
jgi:hypothetical protein